ncbi:MAG: transposase [Campylobacterota bacterium]
MVKNCIHCNHKVLYSLQNGYKKCSRCHKKFSPQKYLKQLAIVKGFCNDQSAHALSKQLGISYKTIATTYEKIRLHVAYVAQLEFEQHESFIEEYDEYLYLPKNKKCIQNNLFDAHNFLIYDYGKIYTLTLPLSVKYAALGMDCMEVGSFLRNHTIANVKKRFNRICAFSLFFEQQMKHYKGVSYDNFDLYLKEIEFKFNFAKPQRYEYLMECIVTNPQSRWHQKG